MSRVGSPLSISRIRLAYGVRRDAARAQLEFLILDPSIWAIERRGQAHIRVGETQSEHVRLDTGPQVEQIAGQRTEEDGDLSRVRREGLA